MVKIISIQPTDEHREKILKLRKKRLAKGYPKLGTVLVAIKTGYAQPQYEDGHITKGKEYVVVDNIDLSEGYYHVQSDDEGIHARLTPFILSELFGWK